MRILFTRATKSPRFLYGLRNDLGSEAPQIRYTALKIHDALLELVSSCPFTPLNRQRVAGGARVPNNCPVCPQLPISSDSGTLLSQAENNREGSNGRPRRFTFISVEAPDASDGVVLVTAGGRHRQLGDNPDQAALRRQRREAMVLNEGNRPVLQEDIIQRSTASFQDETDQNDVRQTELGLERLSTT